MTRVTLYMEGGGNTANTKRRLKRGMDGFLRALKDKCRESRRGWRLIPGGGRNETIEAFGNARAHARADELVVLLVDSEAPVTEATPLDHLRTRLPRERSLDGVPGDAVHLMVQTMETWIVADPEALRAWYGTDFAANALPRARDLETVSGKDVVEALRRATRRTQKGAYHKIRHAGELLERVDPEKAQAQ